MTDGPHDAHSSPTSFPYRAVPGQPDRLAELGNMVGAYLVPGVIVDELYGLATHEREEVERLRGRLKRLEWEGTKCLADITGCEDEPACPACDGLQSEGHHQTCWLAKEIHNA